VVGAVGYSCAARGKEMPTPGMDDLDALVNGQVEKFLAGYIERHREEILGAVNEKASARSIWVSQRRLDIDFGAENALDILAEGLFPAESTETPPGASCGQDGYCNKGEGI